MSTRARIGYKTRNNNDRYHGCVISSHVQMDGDILLEVLNENFNTRKKAFSLCVKGFFSSLHQYVERNCEQTEHEKANSTDRRNESLEDFLNEENNHTEYIEYLYLWTKHDGRFQWKRFAMHWCEHKPSVTIYVAEDEWFAVGSWCWENFDIVSGVSFLPKADDAHIYEAAPYEEVTTDVWGELYEKTKSPIDWDSISEEDDYTIGSQELACTADACEI